MQLSFLIRRIFSKAFSQHVAVGDALESHIAETRNVGKMKLLRPENAKIAVSSTQQYSRPHGVMNRKINSSIFA
jgi:hypothetical protein